MSENAWRTISSKVVYQQPWLAVREDKVVTGSGKEGVYSIAEVKPGALVIALNERSELYLIHSFRYPLQEWRWEIPGGAIEIDTSPLQTAQNELAEELGFRADGWTEIGSIYPSHNGPMNDHCFIFVAHGLRKVKTRHEPGEAIRPPQAFALNDVLAMVRHGELTDGQSLAALLHFVLWRKAEIRKSPL